jgi:hypothetical protein
MKEHIRTILKEWLQYKDGIIFTDDIAINAVVDEIVNFLPPQSEISDEEIEVALKEMYYINHRNNLDKISENRNHIQLDKRIGFREGAKWMRDRLTNKQ